VSTPQPGQELFHHFPGAAWIQFELEQGGLEPGQVLSSNFVATTNVASDLAQGHRPRTSEASRTHDGELRWIEKIRAGALVGRPEAIARRLRFGLFFCSDELVHAERTILLRNEARPARGKVQRRIELDLFRWGAITILAALGIASSRNPRCEE